MDLYAGADSGCAIDLKAGLKLIPPQWQGVGRRFALPLSGSLAGHGTKVAADHIHNVVRAGICQRGLA